MGIFSSIKEKLFGKAETARPTEPVVTAQAEKPITAEATGPVSADLSGTATGAETPAKPDTSVSKPAPSAPVDVAAILDAAVAAKGQKLDWRHSIVDMMKALDLDSSLSARKELAEELDYSGDTSDSAKMNIWLHKVLMKALADNGGKVPAELLD